MAQGPAMKNQPQPPSSEAPLSFVGPVLVVALSQQSPGSDGRLAQSLVESVKDYGKRLQNLQTATDMSSSVVQRTFDGIGELALYRPTVATLIGIYDLAIFYFADDLDSITRVSSHIGAISQEFLFAPLTNQISDSAKKVLGWLQRDRPYPHGGGEDRAPAFLSLSSVKVGDHLLAVGGRALREALAQKIRGMAEAAGCHVAVLNCWSWPELLIIGMDDDLTRLVRLLDDMEAITLGDLEAPIRWDDSTKDSEALALDILDTWERGRWPDAGEGPRRGREGDWSDEDARQTRREAQSRHVIVTVRTQFGFLESAVSAVSAVSAESETATQKILRCFFSRTYGNDKSQGGVGSDWSTVLSAIDESKGLKDASDSPSAQWEITLLAKPGHLIGLLPFVCELAQHWCGALGPGRARVCRGVDGHLTTLRLVVQGPATHQVLLLMAAVSLWFRVNRAVSSQILDATSYLMFDAAAVKRCSAVEQLARLEGRAATCDDVRGFDLLQTKPGPYDEKGLNDLLTSRFLGVTEAMAVREWMGAIQHGLTQRDMFGSMLDLESVRLVVATELIYPSAGQNAARAELAVREWLAAGQAAYQQRIQFSPLMLGGPRLLGELPFGVNQVSNMVAGLAHAIFSVADAPVEFRGQPVPEQECVPDDVKPAVLVLFQADEGISVQIVGNVVIVRLSVGHALSPIALCMLFHELGHWLVDRWSIPGVAPVRVRGAANDWRMAARDLARHVERHEQPVQETHDREGGGAVVLNFYKDVVAHAAWRMLTCGPENRWERFREQFLACMALSVRVENEPSNIFNAPNAWARALVHLRIQQILETEHCTTYQAFVVIELPFHESATLSGQFLSDLNRRSGSLSI